MKKKRRNGGRSGGLPYGRGLLAAGIAWLCLSSPCAYSQTGPSPPQSASDESILSMSAICESLKDHSPVNAGVVFSMAIGRIICVTSFNPVPRRTAVYHSWFHRGELSSKQRVVINPPGATGFSSIQLREADKGPWHVEVSDSSGRILRILRFSIVD